MVYNECNLWAGIYKVQTFGTTQIRYQWFIDLNSRKEEARIYSILDLKVGVFVILRTPYVLKILIYLQIFNIGP